MKNSLWAVTALVLALTAPAAARPATVMQLKADLLGGQSATQVLTQWCSDHRLATPALIRAQQMRGMDKKPDSLTRALLAVGPRDVIRYRRVRLVCGRHVLSEADNWYVPARLTPLMNQTLDHSDKPFGAVVKPLNFRRRTISVTPDAAPGTVLRLEALLQTGAGVPFSVVVENYTDDLVRGDLVKGDRIAGHK